MSFTEYMTDEEIAEDAIYGKVPEFNYLDDLRERLRPAADIVMQYDLSVLFADLMATGLVSKDDFRVRGIDVTEFCHPEDCK